MMNEIRVEVQKSLEIEIVYSHALLEFSHRNNLGFQTRY